MSDSTGTRDAGTSANGASHNGAASNGAASNDSGPNGASRNVTAAGSGRGRARSAPQPLTPAERRERTRRRVIVGAVLLVAINLLVYGVSQTVTNNDASQQALPSEVEAILPVEGSVIRPQDTVGIDLADVPYVVDLFVDGVPIPGDEVDAVRELGQFSFRPGEGRTFSRWAPGPHVIRAEYTPDDPNVPATPGSIEWSITVG